MDKKNCQNCKQDFLIAPEDFIFYEKIKVPAPTFCPECRRQRRLAWMNLLNLYKRDCDLCKKSFVSMYAPEAPYVVYCPKCWWSDNWDWRDYGRGFDESRNFFEQFDDLLKSTPLCGLSINTATTPGSPYNNHAQDLKNCYLTFLTSFNENAVYGVLVTRDKDVFDCSMVMDCESCYDSMNLFKSNGCIGTRGNIRFCLNVWFSRDCDNCTECIGCTNLRNKSYCIFNKQYSKEDYFRIKEKINLGSWQQHTELKKQAEDFWLTQPPKPTYDDHSVDYTGSYVFESKNCKECFDVTGAQDSKYLLMMYNEPTKDTYDVSSWGGNLSLSYEGNVIGEQASNMRFTQETGIGSFDIEYAKLVFGTSHAFGCVSVRKGKYVILNKEYTEQDYMILRKKIIEQMSSMPYKSAEGHVYKYGEFFPMQISPFPYDKTIAQFFNPLTEEQIHTRQLVFGGFDVNTYQVTLKASDLSDNINDVPDTILTDVIECNECAKGYRIIESELSYLRKMKLPIPRQCPFCRIYKKFNVWVDNMHLKTRVCGKCASEFFTHYSEDRAPIVYCKTCYQSEFL